jgi:fatty-acyl-CoA synthase
MTNIAWQLVRAATEHPEKVAIVAPDESEYTYREFDQISNRIGNLLREEHGVTEDDVVAGIMPNSFWSVAFMLGVMKAGAVFTLENYTLKDDTIRGNIDNADVRVVIADNDVFDGVDRFESVDSVVHTRSYSGSEGSGFLDTVWDHSPELSIVPRRREQLAGLNYTSGTTGRPKAVKLTHGTLTSSVRATVYAYHDLTPDDRSLLFLPMYHTGGISSALYATWSQGMLIVAGGWDVDNIVRLVEEYDPTWFYYIVPTMIRDLMNHERWEDLDMDGIKMQVAGSPGPSEMFETMFDALRSKGARPSVSYGMTETMPMGVTIAPIAQDEDLEAPVDSAGRPARELGEVKLVGLHTGEEITEPGEEGEVYFRGDNLTPGYLNDPARTAEAIDEDGWFHTDDLGYFDENGYLYISGRADDMIISGGEKLSLAELDDALLHHEVIEDAGTVGVSHKRFGEVPAAFVVPKDQSLTEADLRDILDEYMLETLARWKRPRLYAIVDEIPRTHSKKTKIKPELESKVDGITLDDEERVRTLSEVRNQ